MFFNECTEGMVGSYLGGAVVLCGGVVVDRDGRASIDRPNKGERETEEERRRPPEETTPCYVLKSEGRNSSVYIYTIYWNTTIFRSSQCGEKCDFRLYRVHDGDEPG